MKNVYYYETPLGRVGIGEEKGFITNLFFPGMVQPKEFQVQETPALLEAGKQLLEYLEGKRRSFDLKYQMEGTEFEKRVWSALLTIPYGETRTYGALAEMVGNPKAARAVGRANSRNPLSIFVPCHRVIGAGGKLTGYAGGVAMKKKLLALEREHRFE